MKILYELIKIVLSILFSFMGAVCYCFVISAISIILFVTFYIIVCPFVQIGAFDIKIALGALATGLLFLAIGYFLATINVRMDYHVTREIDLQKVNVGNLLMGGSPGVSKNIIKWISIILGCISILYGLNLKGIIKIFPSKLLMAPIIFDGKLDFIIWIFLGISFFIEGIVIQHIEKIYRLLMERKNLFHIP